MSELQGTYQAEHRDEEVECIYSAHPSNIPVLYRAVFSAIETLAVMADQIASGGRKLNDEEAVEQCILTIKQLTEALGR